jgi:hypothetical protein
MNNVLKLIAAIFARARKLLDRGHYKAEWTIHKYENDAAHRENKPFRVDHVFQNVLLNEGIGELIDLFCGLGSPTAFSNANAYLGVGDDDTAAAAAQTALLAATNKLYKAMDTSYPSRTDQTVTFRASFGSSDANFAWKEFTIANGSSGTAKNLNRKVSDQGTKTSGQTWVMQLAITFS